MRFPFYTLVYTGAAALAAPVYLARGLKSGKYLWNLKARLGFDLPEFGEKKGRRVWVHALSLGEVTAAVELIKRLDAAGFEVCVSTTTRSGRQAAEEKLGGRPWFSFPFDLPSVVRRTLETIDPDALLLIETDIWPNLLSGLADRSVPALLVNARVSPRSFKGYRRLGRFWGRVLGLFTGLGCQSELDRDRLLALGAPPDRVVITGNLKYDRPAVETGPEVRAALLAETGLPDGLWIAAGSTHPGEEAALLAIYGRLKDRHPDLRLLLVPRNRTRFEEVWGLMIGSKYQAARRTGPRPSGSVDLYLLDTQGELDRFYELGDVVFVGKSLPGSGEGGGHNLLEPAARAKPVLFGPRMHNFPEVARQMIESGGGRQAADAVELETILDELLSDPNRRSEMGARALKAARANQGAVDRTINMLEAALAGTG